MSAATPATYEAGLRRATGVVLCGSFRRGFDELRADSAALVALGCEVLSPKSLEFVHEEDGFVLAEHERHLAPGAIENGHVAALRRADLVWLHAPGGYLGPSGAFELGAANTAGVPVFTRHELRDVALRDYVRRVAVPAAAVATVRETFVADPGAGIRGLQTYYHRVAADRGWTQETAAESMRLLAGEIEELALSLEQSEVSTWSAPDGDVAAELSDVQLYVVHMANVLGLDLASAVTSKEAFNSWRFERKQSHTA
jgi:NTP pyrophosphatase (non-canonical NTP hydrolase)